jgi:hypothetical protein
MGSSNVLIVGLKGLGVEIFNTGEGDVLGYRQSDVGMKARFG